MNVLQGRPVLDVAEPPLPTTSRALPVSTPREFIPRSPVRSIEPPFEEFYPRKNPNTLRNLDNRTIRILENGRRPFWELGQNRSLPGQRNVYWRHSAESPGERVGRPV